MKTVQREANLLQQIAKASAAIRQKHELIKHGRDTTERKMEEIFKPVVTPLKQLVSSSNIPLDDERRIKKEEIKEEEDDVFDPEITEDESFVNIPHQSTPIREPAATSYLKMFDSKVMQKNLDTKYGVRKLAGNRLMVGDSEVRFDDKFIFIQNKKYENTPGLLELLFMKSPDQTKVTEADEENYGKIIHTTHALRKYYNPERSIRSDRNLKKFNDIIEKLISKQGKGLPRYKIKSGQPIDYVYWDDPNELVDRLRLLIASQTAGNPSHSNEIISIIEELREAQIIY